MPNWWEETPLTKLNNTQWEALCDRCGLCCLHKLENDETGDVFYTSVHCKLFDTQKCSCAYYENRLKLVPDCINITPESLPKIANWLPETCAYRRLYQNKPLPNWHPLLNHGKKTFSCHTTINTTLTNELVLSQDEDLEDYICDI